MRVFKYFCARAYALAHVYSGRRYIDGKTNGEKIN